MTQIARRTTATPNLVALAVRATVCAGALALLGANALAANPNADQATRIYNRIAGVPPSAAQLAQMTATDAVSAALIATQDPAFYNNTIRNMAAPWTNRDQSVFVPLNDYTATVVGMVRDDVPFNTLLSADLVYTADGSFRCAGVFLFEQRHVRCDGRQQRRSQGAPGIEHPVSPDRHPRGCDRRNHDDARRRQRVLHQRHEPGDVPLHDAESSVQRHAAGHGHYPAAGSDSPGRDPQPRRRRARCS